MKNFIVLSIVLLMLSGFTSAQNLDEWLTKFEKSDYLSTDDYENSAAYFKKLAENSEYAHYFTFGVSPQGRELAAVIVSKNQNFDPVPLSQRKVPLVMIQNGIHSGEIEGKDACMIMLREILITKEKFNYLDNVDLLIIPIFNVDGHERKSPFNRINQNGPQEMGWRTTSQNYNLNRDFMKADAPEMQALLKLFSDFLPDFYIDTHTTNGADYQYTITYDIQRWQNVYPAASKWISDEYIPFIESEFDKSSYFISPYVGYKKRDVKNGVTYWASSPRFSHGYAVVQNRPGLLIETHMLKPYKDRVFSTQILLEATIKKVGKDSDLLLSINREADEYYSNRSLRHIPLNLTLLDTSFSTMKYKGFKSVRKFSEIAGTEITVYSDIPFEIEVPVYDVFEVKDSALIPLSYYIPKEYEEIVVRLKLHGIEVKELNDNEDREVVVTKFDDVKFPSNPFENRFQPTFTYNEFTETRTLLRGGYLIETNQRTLPVIVHLLEVNAPDSFIKWGFFNHIFERKEYFEVYSMEPIAQQMYKNNKHLRTEFEEKLKDENFAKNLYARLNFFYERSEYFDKKYREYPVYKILR